MKRINLVLLAVFLIIAVRAKAQQQNYTLEGSINDLNVPVAKAYVIYELERGKSIRDSAFITHGKFTIKGTAPYPLKATLYISPSNKTQYFAARLDQMELYLVAGVTTIKSDSLKHAKLTGTQLNIDFQHLKELLAPFEKEEDMLHVLDRNYELIPDKLAQAKQMRKDMIVRRTAAVEAFVKKHLNSIAAMDILPIAVDPAYNLAKAKKVFATFSPSVRNSHSGQAYQKTFLIAIGIPAPDFSSKTLEGEKVTLSSYKGKYVLLDFWASWCLPCRAQNPGLIKIYNKYKEQGFKVLGVSLDAGKRGKEMWQKAITMDHLPWDQVSDLTGFDSEASLLYQITYVPTSFLIDPSGKIIGKNLHGEELEAKLAEILAKSK